MRFLTALFVCCTAEICANSVEYLAYTRVRPETPLCPPLDDKKHNFENYSTFRIKRRLFSVPLPLAFSLTQFSTILFSPTHSHRKRHTHCIVLHPPLQRNHLIGKIYSSKVEGEKKKVSGRN